MTAVTIASSGWQQSISLGGFGELLSVSGAPFAYPLTEVKAAVSRQRERLRTVYPKGYSALNAVGIQTSTRRIPRAPFPL